MQKSYRQLCLQDENVYTLGRSLIGQCNTLVGDWGVGGGVEWSTWTRLNAKRRIATWSDVRLSNCNVYIMF